MELLGLDAFFPEGQGAFGCDSEDRGASCSTLARERAGGWPAARDTSRSATRARRRGAPARPAFARSTSAAEGSATAFRMRTPSATASTSVLPAPCLGRVAGGPGLHSVHGAGARASGRFRASARAAPAADRLGRRGRLEERAAALAKRSIKKEAKRSALQLAISMIDLTTLEGRTPRARSCSSATKASAPLPGDASVPSVAAVCVYPNFVAVAGERARAARRSRSPRSRPAFPSGLSPLDDQARRDAPRASSTAPTRSTW